MLNGALLGWAFWDGVERHEASFDVPSSLLTAGANTVELSAELGAGVTLPQSGTVFISVKDDDKAAITPVARAIADLGFKILATGGTAKHLKEQGLNVENIKKVREGRPHIVDAMKSGQVQLVFNTTEDAKAIADSFELRRTALTNSLPYSTTVAGARAAVKAIEALNSDDLAVAPLQSYFTGSY